MLLSEGQMSDCTSAALMLKALHNVKVLIADKGYDADWSRDALAASKIAACIPPRASRKIPIAHDPALYRARCKIENMFGKLKDWRRIHSRALRTHLLFKHLHSGSCYLLALISES